MYKSQIHFPAFIIGGAAKSGTTSLSRYLSQQPGIFIPNREPNFFTYANNAPQYKTKNHPFIYDIESYLQLLTPTESQAHKNTIGEKSVSYLYKGYYQQVIKNVRKYHPYWEHLKWIFILRNPVERAYSQYIHNLNFHEYLSFRNAIDRWPERKASGWIPAYDYLGAGFYSKPIQAYKQHFKQVRVYLFEDLTERPKWLLNDILLYLEIDQPAQNVAFEKYNPSGIPKNKIFEKGFDLGGNSALKKIIGKALPASFKQNLRKYTHQKPAFSPEIKKEICSLFKPEIIELESLIGRNLSDWYKEGS